MSPISPMVDHLMKVSLEIRSAATNADSGPPNAFEFIYGVGPSGITAFEKALFGRGVGDRIRFEVAPSDYREHVGHLRLPLLRQSGITALEAAQVIVTAVLKAPDREVVRALAAGGSCGDCDCGCGSH